MQEETLDEGVDGKLGDLARTSLGVRAIAIVAVPKTDAIVDDVDKSAIGDGAATEVSGEVVDDTVGRSISLHDLDIPGPVDETPGEMSEGTGMAIIGEHEAALLEGVAESLEEDASEDDHEHLAWEQTGLAGLTPSALGVKAAE